LPGIGLNIADETNARLSCRDKSVEFGDNDIVIISVGELSKRKNQIVLLKAINYLKKTRLLREVTIRALIVGTGDDEKYLRTYVVNHGLSEIVSLLGQRKDVRSLLELSDIYVSASRMEGLPISVLEAMDAKLPLILSNCRGNRELVEEGYNGYLFEVDEYETLAERIAELAVDRRKRTEYGGNSYKKVDSYRLQNIKTDIKRAFDLI
jgi:glycosyltransferase EpsD